MDLKDCFLICCFSVRILAQFSERFDLSSTPSVIGTVGQDVILPCQISLGTLPENMEVQWKKNGDGEIYQFTAATGQETIGPGYQGRAVMTTKEGMAAGNVSLKLKKVQLSDGGIYACVVKSHLYVAKTKTVLHIAALGNVSIEVLDTEGEDIKLACKSAGWYPEPEVQWLVQGSQNLQMKSKQDPEQLFSVSSSITVLRDMREITCSVRERSHLQRKRESTILLSRNNFPHFPTWLLAFWILFILTLLAVGVAVYYRYKGKKKIKHSEEEQRILLGDQKELMQKCNEEMTKLHQENHNLKETLGKLEESLRKCEVENERQQQENQDLNRKLESVNTEVEKLKESLKECKEENERLHQKRPNEDQSGE